MQWSTERVETLKRMWEEGASARQIAERLGGTTRNAVIGKAYRLGLSTGREQPAAVTVQESNRASIMNLTERMCRWPSGHPGQPDFSFCGQPVAPGRPYCAAHCARAYAPKNNSAA